MKPQQLPNEDLIERCKILRDMLTNDNHAQHLTELITRFERLSLGKDAEKAIEKLKELQPIHNWEKLYVGTQQDDEVEALAREIYIEGVVNNPDDYILPAHSFDLAEQFINHRNERRGKNGN